MRGKPSNQRQGRTGYSVANTGGNNKGGTQNMKNGELTPVGVVRDENSRKASLTPRVFPVRLLRSPIKWFLIGFVLAIQVAAINGQGHAEDQYVTIVMSPVVKQKLQQASSAEQKKIEKAIKYGNKLIQYRFNSEDMNFVEDPGGEVLWEKKMAPIVSMGMEEWEDYRNKRWQSQIETGRHHGGLILVNCMSINLIDINTTYNGIDITYRATLLGKFPYFSTSKGKSLDKVDLSVAGKPYDLILHANKVGLITSEYSTEKYTSSSYFDYRQYLTKENDQLVKALKNSFSAITNNKITSIKSILRDLDKSLAICTK
jgi:hypothetical protein